MAVECVVKHAAKSAAEGPHWDDVTNTLLFVDILENTVHRYNPETGTVDVIQLDDQEKVQSQKQKLAQQRREEALIQKKIEVAHKEMERLEKYVNLGVQ